MSKMIKNIACCALISFAFYGCGNWFKECKDCETKKKEEVVTEEKIETPTEITEIKTEEKKVVEEETAVQEQKVSVEEQPK